MKTLITLTHVAVCLVLIVLASPAFSHPPANYAGPAVTLPALPVPPRAAYPQTVERATYAERQGRQLYIDDPVVEDVFIQQRVRQRITRLPTVYEQAIVDEAPMPMSYNAMPYAAEPMPAYGYARYAATSAYAIPAAPRYYAAPMYAAPEGAYTKAEYGPLGRLRRLETTGDPARVPRSTPGPVRTLLFGQ